jgi:hypothetical protein
MIKDLKRLWREKSGNVLIMAGLSMPLIIGFAGLATDTVQWSLAKRELQRSADSAALAGAYTIAQQGNAVQSATDSIASTNDLALDGNPIIENAPTSGAYSGDNNAISVAMNSRMELPFSRIFLSAGALITAKATAAMISNGNYCIISLDTSTATGVEATGNGTVDLNCGIFANSRGPNAVSAGGSATVITDLVGAVGGLTPSGSYSAGVDLLPYSVPQPDPFEDLPDPVPTGCVSRVSVSPKQTKTLSPGCYRGMDLKGTVNFQPGVYYIDGDSLSFGAQAEAIGSGVTFILTSSTASTNPNSIATLSINGGATLKLSSPTMGTYEGVLFYQDSRTPAGTTKINGNSLSVLEGAFYFPSHLLEFNGTSGMTTDCIQLVGFKVKLTGNSKITNVCPVDGSKSFRGAVIRLVS